MSAEQIDLGLDNDCAAVHEIGNDGCDLREEARNFIMDWIDAGVDPFTLSDEVGSFYDGDIVDLF